MNAIQKIQLERVKEGSFNNLDGEKVAKSLEENEELWESFVIGRFKYGTLIELRDLKDGYLNIDEMYILLPKKNVAKMMKVIKSWDADEVGYNCFNKTEFVIKGSAPFHDQLDLYREFGSNDLRNKALIRVWWD